MCYKKYLMITMLLLLLMTEVYGAKKSSIKSPINGSTLSSSKVTFKWKQRGASKYFLSIGTTKNASNLYGALLNVKKSKVIKSKTVTNLPSNGSVIYVKLSSYVSKKWLHNNYTYVSYNDGSSSKSAMISPMSGTTLTSATTTFKWQDSGALEYSLSVGTTKGSANLYSDSQGTATSKTLTNLPTNGSIIYVRLWSKVSNKWMYNDYTYTTYNKPTPRKSAMISPTNGSTLASTTATFRWEDTGASKYVLSVGTTKSSGNLYSAGQGTSVIKTVTNLPSDGSLIYVSLFSKISNKWVYNDYFYRTYDLNAQKSAMISPTNGLTLTSETETFRWENTGALQYALSIGTTKGGTNLYSGVQGTATSKTVTNLPNDGSTIYVRLLSRNSNQWVYNDYTYKTYDDPTLKKALITHPINGSTLTSDTVLFRWNTTDSPYYYLTVTKFNGFVLYSGRESKSSRGKWLKNLPTDGSYIHAKLMSQVSNKWVYKYYTYKTYNKPRASTMISPTNNSRLTSTTATFKWKDTAASEYELSIGTVRAGSDIYLGSQGTSLEKTLTDLPNDGSLIYVRLSSKLPTGEWVYNDYTYNTHANKSVMISPRNHAVLTSRTVTFKWEDTGASEYFLSVKTANHITLYSGSQNTSTETTLTNLHSRSLIHLRLWTRFSNEWFFNDYTYKIMN